jgi:hypothetical protein
VKMRTEHLIAQLLSVRRVAVSRSDPTRMRPCAAGVERASAPRLCYSV